MVAVAIIVIVISFLITRRLRKTLRTVLLIGLSDAGKTAIFSRIVFNKPKKTVTSLKENEATVNDLNLKLIDLPGAERLRMRFWEQYRTKADHVMYVVDSANLKAKIGDLSEHLYQILADDKFKANITIVCHKQDMEEAKSKSEVKSTLEKELNVIEKTKKGQLGKTSNEEENQQFQFKGSLDMNFIETSINNIDQFVKIIL